MFALCVVNLFVNLSQCWVCSRFNPYLCLLFAYKHNWLCIHILKEVRVTIGIFYYIQCLWNSNNKLKLTDLVSLIQEVVTQEQFFICQIWSM